MKIMHTADLHLGYQYSSDFNKETRDLLADNHKKVLLNIIRACEDHECEILLICGDLFDCEPSKELLDFVKETFSKTRIRIFITPGNHDPLSLQCYHTDFPENVHIFREKLENIQLDNNVTLYGIGFIASHITESLVPELVAMEDKTNILMLHGEISTDSLYNPVNPQNFKNISYLALGHIHLPNQNERFSFCGAPQPMSFKEAYEPSILLFDTSTKDIEKISVYEHRFMAIDVDVSKNIENQISSCLSNKKNIILKLHFKGFLNEGEEIPFEDIKSKFSPCTLDIKMINDYQIKYNLALIQNEQSLRGEYVRTVFKNVDDEEMRAKVIHTGLNYLKRG